VEVVPAKAEGLVAEEGLAVVGVLVAQEGLAVGQAAVQALVVERALEQRNRENG
jgi:hypothetical protein